MRHKQHSLPIMEVKLHNTIKQTEIDIHKHSQRQIKKKINLQLQTLK